MNILITSCGRRGYIIKYFTEALKKYAGGGEVHAMNSDGVSVCSRFAHRFTVSPEIYSEGYIDFLLEYCRENEIQAVIPLFDIDIPVLAAARERFAAAGMVLVCCDQGPARLVSDKLDTVNFLKARGFSVPETQVFNKDLLPGTVDFPIIIKPRRGMGSIATFTAETPEELHVFGNFAEKKVKNTYLKFESREIADESVLCQEFVEGTEYGLDIISDLDGNYVTTLVKRKLGMRSGETDACVTEKNPMLEDLGKRLAEALSDKGRLRGNTDADVIVRNGVPYIIDINARFGGGYPFSHEAGADVPGAIIMWLLGRVPKKTMFGIKPGLTLAKMPEVVKL